MVEFLEKVFLVLGNMQKGSSVLFLDIVIHEGQTAENRLRNRPTQSEGQCQGKQNGAGAALGAHHLGPLLLQM